MNQVITGDETWTRKQSQQLVEMVGERPMKARMSKSRLNAMLIVYVPAGQTVTGKFYDSFVCDSNSARRAAYSSLNVQKFLAKKGIPTIPHLPYSPDIVPCDFFLFPKMNHISKKL